MKSEDAVKPSYQRVQEAIRDRILSCEWAPGQQIPTERELEKEFLLSRVTISKGLANLVNEGFLTRRQGQGTFVAQTGRKDTGPRLIKYISPLGVSGKVSIRHGALEAMHDVLAGNGYETGIDFYRTSAEMVGQLRKDTDAYHAGFIIFYEPGDTNVEELRRLVSQSFPFVRVDAYPDGLDADYVVSDNIEGAALVVDHLAELGHRNIAYVTRPVDRSSLTDRLSGFVKGLVMRDLPLSEVNIIRLMHPGESAIGEVADALDILLSAPTRPTAIFFANDDLALEGLECLRAKGIRVPEDVSVVGYDNVDETAVSTVPLTTVAQDFYQMVSEAAAVLMDRIDGGVGQRPVQVRIKPQLVVRKSTRRIEDRGKG